MDPNLLAAVLADQSGILKTLTVEFGPNDSETDTGVDLPAKAMVLDVIVEVSTADDGETIDVGLLSGEDGGDADGFLSGVSLANTGLYTGSVTVTSDNNDYLDTTTYGTLLGNLVAGDNTAEAGDGAFYRIRHLTDSVTAKSISYTCSDGTDDAEGKIHFLLIDLANLRW